MKFSEEIKYHEKQVFFGGSQISYRSGNPFCQEGRTILQVYAIGCAVHPDSCWSKYNKEVRD